MPPPPSPGNNILLDELGTPLCHFPVCELESGQRTCLRTESNGRSGAVQPSGIKRLHQSRAETAETREQPWRGQRAATFQ